MPALFALAVALLCAAPAAAAPRASDFEQSVPGAGQRSPARAAHPGGTLGPVVRAPRRFSLVGFRWRGHAEPRLWLRVRRRGRWSRWVAVPHAHGPRDTTDPVWAGGADAYQLRLSRPLPGLRARFVAVTGRTRVRARRAAAGQPPVVPRADWGASQCQPTSPPSYGRVDVAFVHHTVNANDYRPEESAAIVLAICRYHRNANGWSDIGYNFLVDRYGVVFEGRAGGIESAVVGAQAAGYNSVSTGVSNIGEFTSEPQTDAGMQAMARLLAWKLALHGVPAQGTVNTAGRTFERISGHRDANSTACPGNGLYAQLPALRQMVAAAGGAPAAGATIAAAARRVAFPTPVSLLGRLADPTGAALAGRQVEVQARLASGAWATAATVTTDVAGSWRLTLPTSRSGTFRAHFAGDGAAGPLDSPPLRVAVAPALTARATRSRLRRGRRVTVLGTASPAKRALTLLAYQRVRGTWRLVGTRRARVSGRRLRATFPPAYRALYRFVVSFGGDAANAPARSRPVIVRVI